METLYSLLPQGELHKRLSALSQCLDIPVQLLNEEGKLLQQHGALSSYCSLLRKKVFKKDECPQTHLQAGWISYALGESYTFSCQADLTHIAYPLVNRKLLLGTIIIGPFLMDDPDSTVISGFSEKKKLSPTLCLELYDELRRIPVIRPQRVKQISTLAEYVFAPLLADERLLMRGKQGKLYQQSRINETIQRYKGNHAESSSVFVYQKEKELLQKVKERDIQQAKAVLNDLLGYVLFVEGQDMELIKGHATELTTLLSRVAIDSGAAVNQVLDLNRLYLLKIQQSADYEALCYTLQDIVESFVQSISLPGINHMSPSIRKAVEYIAAHFSEPLSIQSLASVLQISPSHFSALFSKQMNVGFREYLTRLRVEEAKNLLTATEYPISQIAVFVGYADQSSFTKAFKRITGVTPYQLR